jgi:hypothetical protein
LTVYSAGRGNPDSGGLGEFSKKAAKESSWLIKIVGPSWIDVIPDFHFSPLFETYNAEHNDWDLLAHSSALAYSPGSWKYLNSIKVQTDENQIGRVKIGLQDCFLLISGCAYVVTVVGEQSIYSIARLFHILNHKDDQTPFLIKGHG